MIKRMWRANKIFTLLFGLSFTMSFCIVYFGMVLKCQSQMADNVGSQMNYEYRGYYSANWCSSVSKRAEIELPNLEQGILSYHVSIDNGEDVVGKKSAYIILQNHEDLQEPLSEGHYFEQKSSSEYPQCIVGDYWLKFSIKDEDRKLLNIHGYMCEIVGVLQSNTFWGSDERCFLYGDSMPESFMEELIGMNQSIEIDYRISANVDESQVERYENWLQSGSFEDVDEMYMDDVDGGISYEFVSLIPSYRLFYRILLGFSFINCTFLTYVWGIKKTQENMIKRVWGFRMVDIWKDGFIEILLYQVMALLVSNVICLAIEWSQGQVSDYFVTLKSGSVNMMMILIVFSFLLSTIHVFTVRKMNPAETLKAVE